MTFKFITAKKKTHIFSGLLNPFDKAKKFNFQMCSLLNLPDELLVKIFKMLDIGSILKLAKVCKRTRSVSFDCSVWQHRRIVIIQCLLPSEAVALSLQAKIEEITGTSPLIFFSDFSVSLNVVSQVCKRRFKTSEFYPCI